MEMAKKHEAAVSHCQHCFLIFLTFFPFFAFLSVIWLTHSRNPKHVLIGNCLPSAPVRVIGKAPQIFGTVLVIFGRGKDNAFLASDYLREVISTPEKLGHQWQNIVGYRNVYTSVWLRVPCPKVVSPVPGMQHVPMFLLVYMGFKSQENMACVKQSWSLTKACCIFVVKVSGCVLLSIVPWTWKASLLHFLSQQRQRFLSLLGSLICWYPSLVTG